VVTGTVIAAFLILLVMLAAILGYVACWFFWPADTFVWTLVATVCVVIGFIGMRREREREWSR
jgi:hypothetical protein